MDHLHHQKERLIPKSKRTFNRSSKRIHEKPPHRGIIPDSTIYAENSTIIAGEGSQIINPNPTPTTTPTPTPQPTLTITYLESTPDPADQTGQTTKYTFTITTNTQLTYTPNTVNTAIAHLANQYPLKTAEYNIITPIWTASTITNGKGNFDLYSTTELTELQLQTLAKDLQTALSTLL
jgi:hypothetical protein